MNIGLVNFHGLLRNGPVELCQVVIWKVFRKDWRRLSGRDSILKLVIGFTLFIFFENAIDLWLQLVIIIEIAGET